MAAPSIALALALGGPVAAQPAPATPLTVCLDAEVPPLSVRQGQDGGGFDVEVARRVAALLGRPLAVQWFETKADPDSFPDREANALLSDGRCQLVGGYPLTARTIGKPLSERSRLPGFAGARPEDRRRWVNIGTLVPSAAYRAASLGVVLGPAQSGLQFRHLAELQGLRLGVEKRTLPDAILTRYRGGVLFDRVTHVLAGTGLFERLEAGDYDAVLVETQRWDAWAARHPENRLRLAEYRHPVGFNFGFVGLATEAPLLEAVNGAIVRMREAGELPALARQAGLTYAAPLLPEVTPPIAPAALRDD
ncbi:substrate-binding periplasmic protein [Dankookia sp. GCM10030260]|uniref:substrate-binding periplasmic protein n=1 Tax=Dankookia sp. GCM10030260 TaxID=3273390 RepID=UPI0036237DDF